MSNYYEQTCLSIASVSGVYSGETLYHYNNEYYLPPQSLPYGSGIAAHEHRIAQNPLDDETRQRGGCARMTVEQRRQTSIDGAMGEIVFALATNTPYDPYTGREADFQVKGRAVEVKTSATWPNLLVPLDLYEREPDAIYVVVKKTGAHRYRLIGWIEGKDVPEKGNLQDPYDLGPSYRVKMDKLRPFKKLIGPPA